MSVKEKRPPKYVDVEDDTVRPANHTALSDDPIGQGRFVKMRNRPLMSLIHNGPHPRPTWCNGVSLFR